MIFYQFSKRLYFSRFQAVECTNREIHILQLLIEKLTHAEVLLIHCRVVRLILFLYHNTLLREKHKMINQDLSRFSQCILRCNRTVGRNLDGQFLVVGTLLHTELVNGNHYITNRSVNRVDCKHTNRVIGMTVLVAGYITTPLIDSDLYLKISSLIHLCQLQFRVENLKVLKSIVQLTCQESLRLRDMQLDSLSIRFRSLLTDKTNLLEIKNKIGYISDDTGDSSKFMINTTDTNSTNCISLKRA